jgi:hypothetical protein
MARLTGKDDLAVVAGPGRRKALCMSPLPDTTLRSTHRLLDDRPVVLVSPSKVSHAVGNMLVPYLRMWIVFEAVVPGNKL